MNDVIKRKGRQNKLGDLFRDYINFHSKNALIYFFFFKILDQNVININGIEARRPL